ncbi:MAG: TolC family protein [Gammaproteobacteria bacterium]|nr:TolC family protein [Gammaproteobacteria bacterium]
MNKHVRTKVITHLSIRLFAISLLGISVLPWQVAFAQESIDLAWAFEQTLLNNSQLKTYPYELRIGEADKIQAGIKPSPKISVEIENILGTAYHSGLGDAEYTLTLSQTIEMGDKLKSRVTVVDARTQAKMADYQLIRLDVLAETSRRYYQALRLQSLQSVVARRIEQEQQALKVIKHRAQAGAVGQADVSKMALRLAHSQATQQQLTDELSLAKTRLAAMWMSDAQFGMVKGDLSQWPTLPDSDTLNSAVETAPKYFQHQAYQRLADSHLQLAKANGYNNINFGVGIRRFEKSDNQALVFNISMPLTFDNPNRGRITAAYAKKELANAQGELSLAELKLELSEIQQRMLANSRRVTTVIEQLLPNARALLNDTEKGYQQGQYSVLQWVDAQSELFELEHQLIDIQTRIYLQLLELERVTGQPMTQQSNTPGNM